MEPDELEKRAEELYNACPSVKPKWEQLGEATRSVWRQYAAAEERKEGA